MILMDCARADEVRDALRLGHWPEACAQELRAHVAACARCSELVVVTEYLQQARKQTTAALTPAGANLVWVRAQARRRQAALERSGRPIAIAQVFAVAIALLIAVPVVIVIGRSVLGAHTFGSLRPFAAAVSSFAAGTWGMELLGGAALLVLVGAAAVVLSDDRHKD